MITRTMCSWCHELTAERYCPTPLCGHRADLPRMECDCPTCRRHESPKDADGLPLAVGDRVELLEPYGEYTAGRVAAIVRLIKGPAAGVEFGAADEDDYPTVVLIACRSLRRVGRVVV